MYDILILGAGPAGLTASIYATRAGYKVAVLEKMFAGGQAATTFEIENYPGFELINGFDFAQKLESHAKKFNPEFIYGEVQSCELSGEIKKITVSSKTIEAKCVIVATGAKRRHLGVDGEAKYTGLGVSYCATCDGGFFKDKICTVVGGGNIALEDSLYLSKFAKKVYLVHRRDEFRGEKFISDQVRKNEKIELVLNSVVTKISGEERVTSVEVFNKDGTTREIKTDGVFIAIGMVPETAFLNDAVALDENGYIIAGEEGMTSVKGVFAAGDVRTKFLRQIITACSDGATAASECGKYLSEGEI